MVIQAERKNGKIKQLELPDSDLTANAGVEDWSATNDSNPDNDGCVIFENSGSDEVKKGIYIPKKNIKMESYRALLTKYDSIPNIEKVPTIGTSETLVPLLVSAVNQIIDQINDLKDFAKEELENL